MEGHNPPPPPLSPGEVLKSNRSLAIFCVVVVFTITSTASIILRLVAKRINKARLAIEDYVILAAQFLLYGMGSAVMLEVFLASAGHHAYAIPPANVATFLKILVAMQVFYGSVLALIKTSICLFYIKIFFVKPFRIACWIVIAFIICWGTMVVLTGFLLCTPLAFNWDPTIPGGKCANERAAFIAVGVLDLLTDVCVFVLPIPMIWQLQVAKGNKMALFAIFGLGILTMVISILRIQALLATDFLDITFSASYPLLWSFLEPALGITVACGPTLGPLVKNSKFFQRVVTRRTKGSDEATFERLTNSEPAHALPNYPSNVTSVTTKRPPGYPQAYLERDSESGSMTRDGKSGGIGVRREWETQVSWARK